MQEIRGVPTPKWEIALCWAGWLILINVSVFLLLSASVSGIALTSCGLENAACHEEWFWLVPTLLVSGPLFAIGSAWALTFRFRKRGRRFWFLPFAGLGTVAVAVVAAFAVIGLVIN